MILGPRACETTSAATLAPEIIGEPNCGWSPPSISTSPI
jgi:hypothetical protein